MKKLSILLLSVPKRVNTFLPAIINELNKQIGERKDIELLCLLDNKARTVGEKRNMLLREAAGEWITFVDDDDHVADTYVKDIMGALEQHPDSDCVVFNSIVSINGGAGKLCKYGKEYEYTETADLWLGKPSHTMCWRSEIAKQGVFPNENFGEDGKWVGQVWPLIKTQNRIDKVLYFYDFCNATSETRG